MTDDNKCKLRLVYKLYKREKEQDIHINGGNFHYSHFHFRLISVKSVSNISTVSQVGADFKL